jgi:hypothetical protein
MHEQRKTIEKHMVWGLWDLVVRTTTSHVTVLVPARGMHVNVLPVKQAISPTK